MSCEFTCLQSSSLIAKNSLKEKIVNKENIIADTSSACEQILGNELWVHMLTIKHIDSSKYNC